MSLAEEEASAPFSKLKGYRHLGTCDQDTLVVPSRLEAGAIYVTPDDILQNRPRRDMDDGGARASTSTTGSSA